MIPSVLAGHVEQGIKDFMRTTFPVPTPFFSNILENFLAEPGNVFKGCYRHRGEPGINAILIYPMNALATDQAGRLAKLIHNSALKGHVTAGI